MRVERSADGSVRLEVAPREVRLLEVALERAAFLDTPPHLQAGAVEFAERVLRALREAPPAAAPPR